MLGWEPKVIARGRAGAHLYLDRRAGEGATGRGQTDRDRDILRATDPVKKAGSTKGGGYEARGRIFSIGAGFLFAAERLFFFDTNSATGIRNGIGNADRFGFFLAHARRNGNGDRNSAGDPDSDRYAVRRRRRKPELRRRPGLRSATAWATLTETETPTDTIEATLAETFTETFIPTLTATPPNRRPKHRRKP